MRYIVILCSILIIICNANPQKLADTPKDMPIKIWVGKTRYCYTPTFTKNEGYIYIKSCWGAPSARYDVFQRIGYNIGGKWLCLSAPSGVTGFDDSQRLDWDYVKLRPCVINDKNQRWIVKDNEIYTADGKFKIQHYLWYLAISKTTAGFYNHKLDGSMQTWLNTIATPMNLSIKTFLAWTFVGRGQWGIYYLQNNSSYTGEGALKSLYYNPENGHIAQYYQKDGSMYCMRSKQTKSQNWNWVTWASCNDNIPKNKDSYYWEPFLLNGNEGMLKDGNDNILYVTQYGSNWGVPYTAKQTYRDTKNSPKSIFLFSADIGNLNLLVNANIGKNLEYCPAPGKQQSHKREKRTLPSSFALTDEWIKRLYDISQTSNPGERAVIGICGVCLLQTYQMIAEMQEYAYGSPLQSGGYFFNVASHQNPFVSFQSRFPILAQRLQDSMNFFNLGLGDDETQLTRYRRTIYAMSLSMLPQYDWYGSNFVENPSEIRNILQNMLGYPRGALWLYIVVRSNASGTGITAHAEPVLRTDEGIVMIPANAPNHTFEQFRDLLRPMNDIESIMNRLSLNRTRQIYSFGVFQITNQNENPLASMLSQNNCDGLGDHRRGNGGLLRSSLINQCSGGRCALQ